MNRSYIVLCLAALCMGCIPMAEEVHGGAGPSPQYAPDIAFAAAGATFDQALIVAKVPLVPRMAVDALGAWAIRSVCVGGCGRYGRTVDSGFMFGIGVYPVEFIRFITVHHRGHHDQKD